MKARLLVWESRGPALVVVPPGRQELRFLRGTTLRCGVEEEGGGSRSRGGLHHLHAGLRGLPGLLPEGSSGLAWSLTGRPELEEHFCKVLFEFGVEGGEYQVSLLLRGPRRPLGGFPQARPSPLGLPQAPP